MARVGSGDLGQKSRVFERQCGDDIRKLRHLNVKLYAHCNHFQKLSQINLSKYLDLAAWFRTMTLDNGCRRRAGKLTRST